MDIKREGENGKNTFYFPEQNNKINNRKRYVEHNRVAMFKNDMLQQMSRTRDTFVNKLFVIFKTFLSMTVQC